MDPRPINVRSAFYHFYQEYRAVKNIHEYFSLEIEYGQI